MAVLGRLDARADRAEEKGEAHLALVARWDDYLAALGEDRRDDALALLAGEPIAAEVQAQASECELRELRLGAAGPAEAEPPAIERDRHDVWEGEDGLWWTDYPPPEGFDGEEEGEYGDFRYRRTLSPEEQAIIDAEEAEERAADRALGEAQRQAYFFGVEAEEAEPEPDA